MLLVSIVWGWQWTENHLKSLWTTGSHSIETSKVSSNSALPETKTRSELRTQPEKCGYRSLKKRGPKSAEVTKLQKPELQSRRSTTSTAHLARTSSCMWWRKTTLRTKCGRSSRKLTETDTLLLVRSTPTCVATQKLSKSSGCVTSTLIQWCNASQWDCSQRASSWGT